MSFGGSHWCRSRPDIEHRSTDFDQNRSTYSPEHRSMTPTESTASCNAVRILTHEEFTTRHLHPPNPVYVKIDRHSNTAIDVARLNALRPQPKPSDNSPEATSAHSDDAADPMEVDRVPMGRALRKRKEKLRTSGGIVRDLEVQIGNALVPVDFHVLDIKLNWNSSLLLGRAFSPIVGAVCNMQTNQLCLTLIDPHIHYNPIPVKKPQTSSRGIDDLKLIATRHCGADTHQTHRAYYEDYEVERAIEYKDILDKEDRLLHHSSWKRNVSSIYRTVSTLFDTHLHQTSRKQASINTAYYLSIDTNVDRAREGDYSIGSWADDRYHESYVVETTVSDPGADAPHEDNHFKQKNRHHTQPSIDVDNPTSVDRRPEFGRRAYDLFGTRRFFWEEKDEYGVYRDDQGYARDVDGHIIHVSNDDIRKLMERASRDEHSYICLPEYASSFTQTKLVPEIYIKDEINEMFYGVCGAQEKNEGDFQMNLDGVYYPLNDIISWLTTCMEEMRQNITKIQHVADKLRPTLVDNRLPVSVDDNLPHSHPMKSQPDFHTRAEIDHMTSLTSKIEAIHKKIVEIHGYIARQPEASTSIDRHNNKSIDIHRRTSIDEATNRGRLVPKVKSDRSDTHNHGEEISIYIYAIFMRHQFNLESLGDRLQKIDNITATMKDKWCR
ncbi:hypothetical protein DY000_02049245 [Brassica cretica]|uniref:Uncharacterized protein n=1 Tax=Brassica cretica TaxID=69181 RepID=A0ABQ7F2A0_BRACR|nr:hypothetical protein DY000_02049245 [Brassica cretica]